MAHQIEQYYSEKNGGIYTICGCGWQDVTFKDDDVCTQADRHNRTAHDGTFKVVKPEKIHKQVVLTKDTFFDWGVVVAYVIWAFGLFAGIATKNIILAGAAFPVGLFVGAIISYAITESKDKRTHRE